MASYVLRITHPNKPTKHVAIKRLVAIRAEHGTEYTLLDSSGQQPINDATLLRAGSSLAIQTDGKKVLYISKFFNSGIDATFHTADSPATPQPTPEAATPYQPTVAATPASPPAQPRASEPQTPADNDSGMFDSWNMGGSMGGSMGGLLLGGAGLLGLGAIAVAASKDDDDDNTSGGSSSGNSLVTGTVTAGPLLAGHDLKIKLYQALSNNSPDSNNPLVGETTIDANGRFRLQTDYDGVIIAHVYSTNADNDDYDDEISGDKNLATDLYSSAVKLNGSDLEIQVNPLTTLAYKKITEQSLLTDDGVNNSNSAIAHAFNINDLHSEITTVNDNANFNGANGLNNAEQYGAALAILSALDQQSGSIQTAIDNLAAGITLSGQQASLNSSAQQTWQQGLQHYLDNNPSSSKGFLVITSDTSESVAQTLGSSTAYTAQALGEGAIAYSINGGDAALFNIGSLSGNISFKSPPEPGSYRFSVDAIDNSGNTSSQDVTLTVTAVTDTTPPSFSSATSATAINEGSGSNQMIYDADATDDSGTVSYSLKASGDGSLFDIDSSTGEVTLTEDPDYTQHSSYRFTVIASDPSGNNAEQTITLPILKVDSNGPSVSNLTMISDDASNGYLSTEDTVNILVSMDENTLVSGTPTLNLNIGNTTKSANYQSGSGSKELLFRYTLEQGLNDSNGISIDANSLSTSGGSLQDSAGNNANLSHSALSDDSNFKVDTNAPEAALVNPVPIQLEALNHNTGADSMPHITTIGDNGEYVVVWRGEDSNDKHSIFVQRFNADGNTNGSVSQLTAQNRPNAADYEPEVAALGNSGAFAVSWIDYSDAGDREIKVQKFNSNGGTASDAPVSIASFAATFDLPQEVAPKIAATGNDGSFVIAWSAVDTAYNVITQPPLRSLYLQKFNNSGSLDGEVIQFKVNGNSSFDYNPEINALNNGDLVLTWSGLDTDLDQSIYVQHFDSDATAKGDAIKLDVSDRRDASPQLSEVGTSGKYVVSWMGVDSDTGHDNSIFVQLLNADGSTSGNSMVQLEANNKTDGTDSDVKIAALGDDGRFAIVWQGDNSEGGNDSTSIYVQLFNADGSRNGNQAIQLDARGTNGTANQQAQIQAVNSDGDFVVAWQGSDFEGDSSIYLQRINADGNLDGSQIKLEPPYQLQGSDSHPALSAPANDGNFVVSWQGLDAQGDDSVFVQSFNADGLASRVNQANKSIQVGESVNVKSTENGSLYLVNSTLSTSDFLADIARNQTNEDLSFPYSWSEIETTADTLTELSSNGLIPGDYQVYATDSAGNLSSAADYMVHVSAVRNVELTAANGAIASKLGVGTSINATVTLSDNVNVSGSPQLALDIGGKTVQADYQSGSGSKQLIFKYTIQAGDNDTDGIAIIADGLSLNGATISEAVTDGETLDNFNFQGVSSNIDYRVDTSGPVVSFASAGHISTSDSISIISDEPATTVYLVNSQQATQINSVSDIEALEDAQWNSSTTSVLSSDGLTPDASYQLFAVDALNNFSSSPSTDSITLDSEIDSSVVIFDLLSGVSSAHSNRIFDADTSYTIYIRADSTSSELITNLIPSDTSWGDWRGANNLGSDDKVILVGNNADIIGENKGKVDNVSIGSKSIIWQTSNNATAGKITNLSGYVTRATANLTAPTGVKLWIGTWSNVNSGQTLDAVYLTNIPAGLLTSQGLS